MTNFDVEKFMEGRLAAARGIDVETCKMVRIHGNACDPYGIYRDPFVDYGRLLFVVGPGLPKRNKNALKHGWYSLLKQCDKLHWPWRTPQETMRARKAASDSAPDDAGRAGLRQLA